MIVVFLGDPAEPGRCTVQHGCHSSSTPRAIQQHIHNIDTEKPSWAFLDTSAVDNSQSAQLPPVLLAVLANYEHIEGHLIQLNYSKSVYLLYILRTNLTFF